MWIEDASGNFVNIDHFWLLEAFPIADADWTIRAVDAGGSVHDLNGHWSSAAGAQSAIARLTHGVDAAGF